MNYRQIALIIICAACVSSSQTVSAQTPVLGGLVEGRSYYNGYGLQDYGGYGLYGGRGSPYAASDKYDGFGHAFGVYDFGYSGYGNGPYGAGSGSEDEFLSTNRFSHGDANYDGYGTVGPSSAHPQRYNPYGYGVPSWRHHNW